MTESIYNALTYPRILMFTSYILCNSAEYYRFGHKGLIPGLVNMISSESEIILFLVSWALALCTCYSVIDIWRNRLPSTAFKFIENVGIPLSILLALPIKKSISENRLYEDYSWIIGRLLPLL